MVNTGACAVIRMLTFTAGVLGIDRHRAVAASLSVVSAVIYQHSHRADYRGAADGTVVVVRIEVLWRQGLARESIGMIVTFGDVQRDAGHSPWGQAGLGRGFACRLIGGLACGLASVIRL